MEIHSLHAFINIKGGFNNNCKDVYFARAIGRKDGLLQDIKQMDQEACSLMQTGKIRYKRIQGLPRLSSIEDADTYSGYYAQWMETSRKRMKTKVFSRDERLAEILGSACSFVLKKYMELKKNITESMEKNFIAKLTYWYDYVMKDVFCEWNGGSVVKIVAHNVTNEQEYLFYYMLTLTGADVLLIQAEKDLEKGQELLKLSSGFVLGELGELQTPEFFSCERVKLQLPERATVTKRTTVVKPPDSMEKSFEELALLASSVVMISIHDGNGEVIGTGSGIMVGKKGYLLTNSHVASGGRFYSIRIEEDQQIYSTDEVIKYNTVLDLAILRINRELNPIPVYKGKMKLVRGQKVVAIGSPLGLFNSVSDGIISGFRTINNVDMIQFTAPISHGSSGGAVLNMQGEVIGISTAGIDSGQNINLAMGYEGINMFIQGFV
ncbi:S1C family serine protease [Anaeromicropila populeti]|nr:S1C family serine protease [Anaeromicropila populeti]